LAANNKHRFQDNRLNTDHILTENTNSYRSYRKDFRDYYRGYKYDRNILELVADVYFA
jgi:hypothetical protein